MFFNASICVSISVFSFEVAMSGLTPVPSQFVLVIGFIALPFGMKATNCPARLTSLPGLAPPPVGSPTTIAFFKDCKS